MLIEGPFKFGVVEKEDFSGSELHLDFTDAYKALSVDEQAETLHNYIMQLRKDTAGLDEKDKDRQGMLIITQVSEQLLPHIKAGEIPLHETIVIELQTSSVFGKIMPARSAD